MGIFPDNDYPYSEADCDSIEKINKSVIVKKFAKLVAVEIERMAADVICSMPTPQKKKK